MKNIFFLSLLIFSQLSFSATSAEIAICSMSSDEISNLELELSETKTQISKLKITNNIQIGSSVLNLIATAYVFKGTVIDTKMEYLPFLFYAGYTTAAGITNYVLNKKDIDLAEELIPVLEREITKAKELNSSNCETFMGVTADENVQISELKLAIKGLTMTQKELTKALEWQPVSTLIKVSSMVAIAAALRHVVLGGPKRLWPIFAVFGGVAGNVLGESLAISTTLLNRGEVESLSIEIKGQLEVMQETLRSLEQLRSLKAKYN